MKKFALSALAVFALAGVAGAQIVDWNLSGAPGNQVSQPPNTSAANVTGMSITRGAGISASAGSNSISSAGWEGTAADEYFSLGFTVGAGYSVNLGSLYIGTRSSSTGPGTVGLYYSGDGFASPLTTIVQPSATFVNSAIDLSALTGLTGNVEFRIYEIGNTQASGAGATAATGTFRLTAYFVGGVFDRNLQFTGTVVPTPGALAIAGVAGLVAVRRRRA